ncbi:hypothetical protein DERP_001753 [Dermatophagoides pteronyssinus]|uniref:Uncharacterized protein n=1 Tax=Dermatophagoides pteronyssinus TaxID=6956 RepID=A0ABQ8JBZ4_DERPT|nr:hypothetical protein DERP_001753 [Dermatophagoides pteronyssinus]
MIKISFSFFHTTTTKKKAAEYHQYTYFTLVGKNYLLLARYIGLLCVYYCTNNFRNIFVLKIESYKYQM